MKQLMLITLLLPIVALAGEADTACQLAKAKAESSAAALVAPQAFAGLGNSSSTEQSVTAGVSESFSGWRRGKLLRQSADAQCDALQATTMLDQHARGAMDNVLRTAAKEELSTLYTLEPVAIDTVKRLEIQLSEHVVDVLQVENARDQLELIRQRQADLLKIISKPPIDISNENLNDVYQKARDASARSASLDARASATIGWDISIAAGGIEPISGNGSGQNSLQPFVSLNVKYSFGEGASRHAAKDVEHLTSQLMDEQGGGYRIAIDRERETIEGLLGSDRAHLKDLTGRNVELTDVLAAIKDVQSIAADVIRDLTTLKLGAIQADIKGTSSRITQYQNLLAQVR